MKRVFLVVLCIVIFVSGCTDAVAATGEITSPAPIVSPENPASPSASPVPSPTPSPGKAVSAATATPAATASPAEPERANLLAAGDLMCLYAQLQAARKNGKYEFDYCFGEVKDKISAADLAIGNLETLVASGYTLTKHGQKGNPKINGPESFVSAVAGAGFDAVTDANNHIFDRKYDGIDKTLQVVDKFGLKHTGAYATGQERQQLIIDVKGIKVAVLAYTYFINGHPRNVKNVNLYKRELVTADIAAAKSAGADFIMVYMHWGKERTHKVNKTQKKEAAFIANAGADIIIGMHPHCTQGTELIDTDHGQVPVFYSLGNYVSSMGATICRDAFMVNLTLEKDPVSGKTIIAELTYTPTYIMKTSAGRFVVVPADLASIAAHNNSKSLMSSRARTIKVIGDKVATPL